MSYNFDEDVNKFGMNSTKWEFINKEGKLSFTDHAHAKYGDERVLPMWVADMDFACAPEITQAIQERAARGVFGYASATDSYYEAIINWAARRYGRTIERDWIVITPGTVPAISLVIQTFVQPGEKVLVQRPVYYPFFDVIELNGAEVVSNTLVLENASTKQRPGVAGRSGRYHMDFDDLARKTADPKVKLAVLCSPHNPIGRVWTAEELRCFGEICLQNDVLVVSDEVHCDLIYQDAEFVSFAALGEEFEQNSIVCMAANKSFNIAGLRISNLIIPDATMRERVEQTIQRVGLKGANIFGLVGTEAAYNFGEHWLTAVNAYIEANANFMRDFLETHLPQVKLIQPEGTYLAWVDFRALGLGEAERKDLIFNKAKVYLDEGEMFGPEGEGFERFNLACPRHILEEALQRIHRVIEEL